MFILEFLSLRKGEKRRGVMESLSKQKTRLLRLHDNGLFDSNVSVRLKGAESIHTKTQFNLYKV